MVKWRGQVAVYATDEREIMSQLRVSEQALVHALKAFTDGEIQEDAQQARVTERGSSSSTPGHGTPGNTKSQPFSTSGEIQNPLEIQGVKPRAYAGNLAPSGQQEDRVPRPGTPDVTPVYTNPEDIEFGKPKRRKRIYALVTTWRQSCQVPTKREGEFWIKVWKAWHERQGWKVTSHPSGYFATDPAGARVAISLHEYDAASHERLN